MAEQGKRLGSNANAKQPGTTPEKPNDIKSALAKQLITNQTNNITEQNKNINKKNDIKSSDNISSILSSINSTITQMFQSVKIQQKSAVNLESASLENKKLLTEISNKLNLNKANPPSITKKITVDISDISTETISKFINSFKSEILDSLRNNIQEINTKIDSSSNETNNTSLNTFLNDYKIITDNFINDLKSNTFNVNTLNNAITTISQNITDFKNKNTNIETQLINAVNLLSNINDSINSNFKTLTDNYINNISNSNNTSKISDQSNILDQVNTYISNDNESKKVNIEFSQENVDKFLESFEKSTIIQNLNFKDDFKKQFQETEEVLSKRIDQLKDDLNNNFVNLINQIIPQSSNKTTESSNNLNPIKLNNNNNNNNSNNLNNLNNLNKTNDNTNIISTPKTLVKNISTNKKINSTLDISIPTLTNTGSNKTLTESVSPNITQNTLTNLNNNTSDNNNLAFTIPNRQTLLNQQNNIQSKMFAATGTQVSLTDNPFKSIFSVTNQQQEKMIKFLNSINDNIEKIYNVFIKHLDNLENDSIDRARNESSLKSGENTDNISDTDIENIVGGNSGVNLEGLSGGGEGGGGMSLRRYNTELVWIYMILLVQ